MPCASRKRLWIDLGQFSRQRAEATRQTRRGWVYRSDTDPDGGRNLRSLPALVGRLLSQLRALANIRDDQEFLGPC